jgi:hypothetical protein
MLGGGDQGSIEQLASGATVVELKSLVDDDECAFMMGVLLIKVVEYLRARGNTQGCRLVVVVEEAHRLLSDVQPTNPEVAGNARFKAVSMFTNLLAEIRAYGAGLVICDQSPSKLARDVIKNTNTKIAHRIVSADDATTLAAAMRLRRDQAGALASLSPGRAAVFSPGDDYPVLVSVPLIKQDKPWPTNAELTSKEQASSPKLDQHAVWVDRLAESREFAKGVDRLLNILIVAPDVAATVWSDLLDMALRLFPRLPEPTRIVRLAATRSLAVLLSVRGRTYGWDYEELGVLGDEAASVVVALSKGEFSGTNPARASFHNRVSRLHGVSRGPLLSCATSCTAGRGVQCVFRCSAAHLSKSRIWSENWRRAATAASEDSGKSLVLLACHASEAMIKVGRSGIDQAWFYRGAFCFAQHMIAEELNGSASSAILDYNDFVWKRLHDDEATITQVSDRRTTHE